jgi:hypothetical protein
MATSGYLALATSGYFFMARDKELRSVLRPEARPSSPTSLPSA